MSRAVASLAVLAGLAFPAAGCGGDGGGGSAGASSASGESTSTSASASSSRSSSSSSTPSSARKRRGVAIGTMSTPEGRVLVNGDGQVLYLFTRENGSRSRCYGDCAAAWPPAYTRGKPRAGTGVDASLLGTARRRDGRRIATYNGHPLYYYAHERRRQVLCQGIVEFGGTWYVVAPGGDAILKRFSVT